MIGASATGNLHRSPADATSGYLCNPLLLSRAHITDIIGTFPSIRKVRRSDITSWRPRVRAALVEKPPA